MIKDFKKLSLKQKAVTSLMGLGTIGSMLVPIPEVSLPPALATHKRIHKKED